MPYCIKCYHLNPGKLESCEVCATPLLLSGAFHLTRPLQELPLEKLIKYPYRHPTLVFEAEDQHMGTLRVIKILQSEEPDAIARFQQELEVLEELEHPGIPQNAWTFSVSIGGEKYRHCLVMERIDGNNLKVWIEQNGKIPEAKAIDWLRQLLAIVNFLHQSYWMHRDIKPENIMVRPDGELVLIDFGVARSVTRTFVHKRNRGGSVTCVGTFGYAPMEQLQGEGDFRSDFFALGHTIVYALTGKGPFDLRQNGKSVWREQIQVSAGFGDVLDEMMREKADDRLTHIQEILRRLDQLQLDQGLKGLPLIQSGQGVPKQLVLKQPVLKHVAPKQLSWVVGVALVIGSAGLIGWPRLAVPAIADYFVAQGRTALGEGALKDAEKAFRKAGDINPKDARIATDLGVVLSLRGDLETAIDALRTAVELDPNDGIARFHLALNLDAQNNIDAAKPQYQMALQLARQAENLDRRTIAIIQGNLARILNIRDPFQPDEAKALALAAIENSNFSEIKDEAGMERLRSNFYKNLGWSELQLKNYDLAYHALETAINLNNSNASAHCLMAQVKSQLGVNPDLSWQECINQSDRSESRSFELNLWRQIATLALRD